MAEQLTYKGSGVDYSIMDPFKILCQQAGIETREAFKRSLTQRMVLIEEYEQSRGESAYLQLLHTPADDYLIAHAHEGLGTKNLIADAMKKLTGKTYYDSIAQDTVAMIVNDMITLGALPTSVAMHLSVGDGSWFDDQERINALVTGWKNACIDAGCIWSCGETPTLKDVLLPEAAELSGSALGIVQQKNQLFDGSKIEDGDAILFIESSGVHANGLTLARKIAGILPEGYLTPIEEGGQSFGEALLEPTPIYVPFIDDWIRIGADIHYAVNITGHGWRKLMRANKSFTYVIETLPWQNPIFDFIQKQGNIADEEMYGNYNMGAGFAVFLPREMAYRVIAYEHKTQRMPEHIISGHGPVFVAGYVKKSDAKKVIIRPKNLMFEGKSLQVRQ